MTDNSLHRTHLRNTVQIGPQNVKCGFAVAILSVTMLWNALSLMAQDRRVVIYPLNSNYEEFTSWRAGTQYVAGRYTAIVVVADQMDKVYSIHCDVTKRWDHCHSLTQDAYQVEIRGHSMKVWAQWEGNQHKEYGDKFTIDNIAALSTPFRDHGDIEIFKKSDEFKRLLNTKPDSR